MYRLFHAFVWLLAWLPLRVHYLFADLLFPIVYWVVRYRRKVVRKNLQNAFPGKPLPEIRRLERQFYRYLLDSFVETFYAMHMSDAEIKQRFTCTGIADVENAALLHGGSIVMLGHCVNWEWMATFGIYFQDDRTRLFTIYKALRNKNMDRLLFQIRGHKGNINVERKHLLRVMTSNRQNGTPAVYGMISDQTPTGGNIHYWTDFLHQDTPMFTGAETLARKFGLPVFYAHLTRRKRGYYHCTFIQITGQPEQMPPFSITEKYARLLETNILEHPAYWLWSHKRWKYKR